MIEKFVEEQRKQNKEWLREDNLKYKNLLDFKVVI